MASDQVAVSGITPAKSGNDWFLIDTSGDFSLDKSIIATIWLVGGGCDGTSGVWNGNTVDSNNNPIPDTGTGTSYSGSGGDGGYVFTARNVKIPKNQNVSTIIANANDKSGTSLSFNGVDYYCNQSGSILRNGGDGGSLPLPSSGQSYTSQDNAILSTSGQDGIETPYGFVGSSGGGGAVCNGQTNAVNGVEGGNGAGSGTNHRSAGTDAINYGCGGGGGAICGKIAQGQSGGNGKQGCVIISYTIEESTLIVQKHYKRTCNTHKTSSTDYYSNNSSHSCCSGESSCCGNTNWNTNNSDYTDTIHIGSLSALQNQVSDLTSKIQNVENENSELQTKISELQTQIDSAKGG